MSKNFECFAFATPTTQNGGWTSVGDGANNKKLILSKDGVTMKLDEGDIEKLISSLSFFDPRLY